MATYPLEFRRSFTVTTPTTLQPEPPSNAWDNLLERAQLFWKMKYEA